MSHECPDDNGPRRGSSVARHEFVADRGGGRGAEPLGQAQGSAAAGRPLPQLFDYDGWAWELLKPADLFGPAMELRVIEERVAMRLWAHANRRTGFTRVTSGRIAALIERDLGGKSRGGSKNHVEAARAELARRRFIERAWEDGHKGWRLLPPGAWLRKSGRQHHREAGPASKTPAAGVSQPEDDASGEGEKLLPREFADTAEGIFQPGLPFGEPAAEKTPATGVFTPGTVPQKTPATGVKNSRHGSKKLPPREFSSNKEGTYPRTVSNDDDQAPSSDLLPLIDEMVGLGISRSQAAELARNFPAHLPIAWSNFKLLRAAGKCFTSPAGWIAVQCRYEAAPIECLPAGAGAESEAERKRRQFREELEKRS